MAKTNQSKAEFADDMRVIGVYPDLTPEAGSEFADDIEQTLLYEDLLEQGYKVMGVIDKNTTEEDIHEIAVRIAEKTVPPADSPVWAALAEKVYDEMELRYKTMLFLTEPERVEFEKEIEEHEQIGDAEQFIFDRYQEVMRGIEQNA